MANDGPPRYRFGVFEVDTGSGELRRQGMRIRLHPQPFQVLCLLLDRPGEVLSREEISRQLWPDGTFVDYEHGVNAAVNRLREALRDRAGSPQFVETLPRRGYRFIGSLEVLSGAPNAALQHTPTPSDNREPPLGETQPAASAEPARATSWLSSAEDLPRAPRVLVQALFLALQLMYLGFYVSTLAHLQEISDLMTPLPHPELLFRLVSVSAGVLIPLRLFVATAALFRPPRMRARYLQLWPFALGADLAWALGPFLLLNHMSYGVALACVAPLVYAPFAQRALVLMGALG